MSAPDDGRKRLRRGQCASELLGRLRVGAPARQQGEDDTGPSKSPTGRGNRSKADNTSSDDGERSQGLDVGKDVYDHRTLCLESTLDCRSEICGIRNPNPTAPMSSAIRAKSRGLNIHSSVAFGDCRPPYARSKPRTA